MIWHITNLLLNKNIISDVGLKPSQSLAVPGREHDRFHPAPSGAMVTPDRLLKERQPASRPVQLTCGCKPVYRGGNETTAEAISRPRLPVMTISRCASIVLSTPSALFLISPALQSIACKTDSTRTAIGRQERSRLGKPKVWNRPNGPNDAEIVPPITPGPLLTTCALQPLFSGL